MDILFRCGDLFQNAEEGKLHHQNYWYVRIYESDSRGGGGRGGYPKIRKIFFLKSVIYCFKTSEFNLTEFFQLAIQASLRIWNEKILRSEIYRIF